MPEDTRLPMTPQKDNAIITLVDRFTKMVVLIPCDFSISGVEVAKLLVEKVFCKYWVCRCLGVGS
jgi:hypothetical protein